MILFSMVTRDQSFASAFCEAAELVKKERKKKGAVCKLFRRQTKKSLPEASRSAMGKRNATTVGLRSNARRIRFEILLPTKKAEKKALIPSQVSDDRDSTIHPSVSTKTPLNCCNGLYGKYTEPFYPHYLFGSRN